MREAQRAVMTGRHTRGLCDRVLLEPLPSRSIRVRLSVFVAQVAMRAAELDAEIASLVRERLSRAEARPTQARSVAHERAEGRRHAAAPQPRVLVKHGT